MNKALTLTWLFRAKYFSISLALPQAEATRPPNQSAFKCVVVLRDVTPERGKGLTGFRKDQLNCKGKVSLDSSKYCNNPACPFENKALASRLTPAFSLLMVLWFTTCLPQTSSVKNLLNYFSFQFLHLPLSVRLGHVFGLWAPRVRL